MLCGRNSRRRVVRGFGFAPLNCVDSLRSVYCVSVKPPAAKPCAIFPTFAKENNPQKTRVLLFVSPLRVFSFALFGLLASGSALGGSPVPRWFCLVRGVVRVPLAFSFLARFLCFVSVRGFVFGSVRSLRAGASRLFCRRRVSGFVPGGFVWLAFLRRLRRVRPGAWFAPFVRFVWALVGAAVAAALRRRFVCGAAFRAGFVVRRVLSGGAFVFRCGFYVCSDWLLRFARLAVGVFAARCVVRFGGFFG